MNLRNTLAGSAGFFLVRVGSLIVNDSPSPFLRERVGVRGPFFFYIS